MSQVTGQAVAVRAALETSGLDHGPISVHDTMHTMGQDPVPSTASLARIFRETGMARLEPKKKPRSDVAPHAAASENPQAAITVVDKAITAHGVPQRLLSNCPHKLSTSTQA